MKLKKEVREAFLKECEENAKKIKQASIDLGKVLNKEFGKITKQV